MAEKSALEAKYTELASANEETVQQFTNAEEQLQKAKTEQEETLTALASAKEALVRQYLGYLFFVASLKNILFYRPKPVKNVAGSRTPLRS